MNFETFLAETNKLNETLQADLAKVDTQIIALSESKADIMKKSNEAAQALVKLHGEFVEAETKKQVANNASTVATAKLASK